MEFSKHPKLTKWISFFLIFSLGNLAIGQKNDYSGLESIYEGILQGYNRNLRPGQAVSPTKVGITIHVLSISKVDDFNQEFHWDMYFRQFWNDDRLNFENKGSSKVEQVASAALKTKVWVPDPFFANQREGHVLDNPADNTLFRISRNGDVLYSSRQLVRTSCPMDLKNYPFDVQTCNLEIESFAHTVNDINYYWREGANSSVTLNADLTVPNFKLEKMELKTTLAKTKTGEYDRLFASFTVKRNIGSFLYKSAIPAAIVMVMSWLAFWLDPVDDIGPRVLIIGISKLAILVLAANATSQLNVSYMTQAHSFFINCLLFLLANVVVTLLLLVIGRNAKQMEENGRCQNRCLEKMTWLDLVFRATYLPVFFVYYAAYIAG